MSLQRASSTFICQSTPRWFAVEQFGDRGPRFTRGFLVMTPGVTIRQRLRVLQPNDPDSYYGDRELVPGDMLRDLEKAKIVITNYHALSRRRQR